MLKLFSVFISLLIAVPALAQDLPPADADRMQARIDALSEFGANMDGGVDRVAYSDADIAARAWLIREMEGLGLDVWTDTAGNIIGRRAGADAELPVILFGSHIDSVPGGGNYDGDVGVVSALEAIELLNEVGIETRHPLEVVNFQNEEGGLVGSLAMTGHLEDNTLAEPSHVPGLTIGEGMARIGADLASLDDAVRGPDSIRAFIELHIEQGAFLDESGTDIGVVTGIVGIRWWDVTITGMANHAGTTPMNRRRDAMVAAARLTLAVNETANNLDGRQVATVGRIQAFPGAPNVIPGRVVMSLEIRDLDADKMQQVFDLVEARAADIAAETGTSIAFREINVASAPQPTAPQMRGIIEQAAEDAGLTAMRMPSGAGHDAQDLAKIVPTGMIFVPSEGGISHSPGELTHPQDMANGADVLVRTILAIDRGALDG